MEHENRKPVALGWEGATGSEPYLDSPRGYGSEGTEITEHPQPPTSVTPRLERHAEHIHALGPRAIAELLCELADAHGIRPDLDARLDAYRRLSPDMLRAVGGDRFPARIFDVGGGA